MRHALATAAVLVLALLPGAAQDKKKPAPKSEPRVIFTVPLGAVPGKTTRLTLRGAGLDDAKDVQIPAGAGSVKIVGKGKAAVPDKNPEKVGDTQVEVELKLDAKFSAATIALVVVTPAGATKPHDVLVETKLPVIAEKESNEGFRAAQSITLPAVIDGVIGRPRDVDVYRIAGKKGQRIEAQTLASRHGAPLDAILTLYNSAGQQIAVNDDFAKEHRDARLETTLPADGNYYLAVIDAHDAGSNLHVYRLMVK